MLYDGYYSHAVWDWALLLSKCQYNSREGSKSLQFL